MDIRETGFEYLFMKMYYISNPMRFKKLEREWRHITEMCRELDLRSGADENREPGEQSQSSVR